MSIDTEKVLELVYDLGDLDFNRMSKDGQEIYNLICDHLNLEPVKNAKPHSEMFKNIGDCV